MAEQHTRPPDLSPTELPQPSVAPAGRYTFASMADRYGLLRDACYFKPTYTALHASSDQARHSIEDLLQGIWRSPGSADIVQGLFDDRLRSHTFELGDVLEQIRERVAIYRQHFDELEQAKLDVKNVRHRWTDPLGRLGAVADPDLVSALHDLDAQQRQERLSCWKDVSSLRQQVPEHWRQYLGAVRQYTLLDSSNTQAPHSGAGAGGERYARQ